MAVRRLLVVALAGYRMWFFATTYWPSNTPLATHATSMQKCAACNCLSCMPWAERCCKNGSPSLCCQVSKIYIAIPLGQLDAGSAAVFQCWPQAATWLWLLAAKKLAVWLSCLRASIASCARLQPTLSSIAVIQLLLRRLERGEVANHHSSCVVLKYDDFCYVVTASSVHVCVLPCPTMYVTS